MLEMTFKIFPKLHCQLLRQQLRVGFQPQLGNVFFFNSKKEELFFCFCDFYLAIAQAHHVVAIQRCHHFRLDFPHFQSIRSKYDVQAKFIFLPINLLGFRNPASIDERSLALFRHHFPNSLHVRTASGQIGCDIFNSATTHL